MNTAVPLVADPAGGGGQEPAHTGSLARRMMGIAAGWIFALLLLGSVIVITADMQLLRLPHGLVAHGFDGLPTHPKKFNPGLLKFVD